MANNAGTILSRIKDEEIDWVDLRFTDPKGKWQHLTMASGVVDEDNLTDGFMFDGSSIAGWKAINESDMILKPDLDAAYVDPFSATPMMIVFCDIVEPSTGELYSRDPRSTAKRAEAFLELVFANDRADHRQVLPLALGIGEAEIDPFDLLVLDPLHDIRCAGHGIPSLRMCGVLGPAPSRTGGRWRFRSPLRPSRRCGCEAPIRSR